MLWFEDYPRFVTPYAKRLEEHLKEFGLILSPPVIKDNADDLENTLKTREFDLILVDLNLGEGKTETLLGNEVIERIRRQEVYTDVIFYSRIENIKDKDYLVEGTFFAETNGDKFFEKVQRVVDWNLNRNLNIAVTRGIFIATTIDLVEQVEEIILKILKLEGEQLLFFKDSVVQAEFFTDRAKYDIIKDFLRNEIEKLTEEKKNTNVATVQALDDKITELGKMKDTFNKFEPDVIEARNKLAHAKCVQGEKNTLRIRDRGKRIYKNVPYDMDECKETREKFAVQNDNLKKIAAFVDALSEKR